MSQKKKTGGWSSYNLSILKAVPPNALFMKEFVIVYTSVCPTGWMHPFECKFLELPGQ